MKKHLHLDGKNIYIVVTGCNAVKRIKELIEPLQMDGANCFLIPTPSAVDIMKKNLKYYSECDVCLNTDFSVHHKIPEEDLVVVAPCSFNTANKIALGIADNYAMSLTQTAIGKKKPVILSFSMNEGLWNHFAFQENLNKLSKAKNITGIWPEFLYEGSQFSRLTMAPFEKTIDTIYKTFGVLRYEEIQAKKSQDFDKIIESNAAEFIHCGRQLQENNFVRQTAGCIGKKIDEGILVSTTGAKIGELTKENISLIKSCDDNTVIWQGDFPPTSESLLLFCIFKNLLDSYLIHTHDTKITYDPRLHHLQTKNYVETGRTASSGEIIDILNRHDGVAVLKLHGQIATSNSFQTAMKKLLDLRQSLIKE